MYIPIILGTARQGRQSEKVANFVLEEAKKFGLETEIIDVRDYRIKTTDNTGEIPEAKKFAEKINKADGIIIVAPEYNFSYPGELKMLLDMLYKQYNRKPVAFCGVSAGGFGGVRAVEQLKLLTLAFKMIPSGENLYFSVVQDLFDEQGKIKDGSYKEKARKFLDGLVWLADQLKRSF